MTDDIHSRLRSDPHIAECATLMRGFADSLIRRMEKGSGPPDRTSVDTAVQRITTLMRDNCAKAAAALVEEREREAAARLAAAASGSHAPERSRHLLRAMAASFIDLVQTAENPHGVFPKGLLEGVDAYFRNALGPIVYEALNDEAKAALTFLGPEAASDAEMWHALHTHPVAQRFIITVLYQIASYWQQFGRAARTFQNTVESATQGTVRLTPSGAERLALRMFHPLFQRLEDERDRVKLDHWCGQGAALQVRALKRAYEDWAKTIEPGGMTRPKAAAGG